MAPRREAVGVAASFTCEPLSDWLGWWLERALGRRVKLSLASYAALHHELHAPSAFRASSGAVGFLRFADWQSDGRPFDALSFEADLALFVDSLRQALHTHVRRLVLVLCPVRACVNAKGRRAAFAEASRKLQALALEEPRLSVVSASEVKRWYPCQQPYDPIAGELGHLPYTDEMCCALAGAAARALLPCLSAPLKAVVVDCDYTLWHDAVGEAGPEGVTIEGRHLELQHRLLALRERGVLLCICSRNLEADVWAVLQRPDVPLSREHVSAFRIAPTLQKSNAIQQLAGEVEAPVESLLFVDDNAAEIGEVRTRLPQLLTWLMPQTDPEVRTQLAHVWPMDLVGRAAATDADVHRAKLRAADAPRAALRACSGSLAEYHRALNVQVQISSLVGADGPTLERVIQLHERTNQFNAWKRRPPSRDDMRLAPLGMFVHVRDRYGDYGLVGATLCRLGNDERYGAMLFVHSFVMSCRVLGRGVEHAMARALGEAAAAQSPPCQRVAFGMCVASRNQPICAFLLRLQDESRRSQRYGEMGCVMLGVNEVRHGGAVDEELPAACDSIWARETVGQCANGPSLPDPASNETEGQVEQNSPFFGALPEIWRVCDTEQLCTLSFDPEVATHAGKHATDDSAVDTDDLSEEAIVMARQTERLARIPLELRSVAEALRLRCGNAGPLPRISTNSSVADVRHLLYAIWRRVLRLTGELNGESEEAQLDATPFEALGGDSTSGVQAKSLAIQHGLSLPADVQLERLNIAQLVEIWQRECARSSMSEKENVVRACDKSLDNGQSAPLTTLAPIRVGRYHYGASAPPKTTLRILERDGRTPYAELEDRGGISACAIGDVARARALAKEGWQPGHAVDKFGSTALMWCASYGQLDTAIWLVEEAKVPVDAANKVGRTALMFAAKYGQYDVARYLLNEAGADVTLRMRDDSTAFDWAVFGGHQPTMELIMSHPLVDVSALNRFGCAAVQWAAAAGNIDTCRWLMSKGLDLGHVNDARHGAVAKAAWKGHDTMLHWLLSAEDGPRLTSQLKIEDLEGRSVAELARMNGQHTTADLLEELILLEMARSSPASS